MNQELTISSGLPVYLCKEYENVWNRNKELLSLLFDNRICIDDKGKYLEDLGKAFERVESTSPYKKQYESIILDLIYNRRKMIRIDEDYSEIKLCKKSIDKIYLVPEKPAEEIEHLTKSNNEITFCTGSNVFDIVTKLPPDLLLEDGEVYDLPKIVEPCARHSKTLSIIDPFIHNLWAFIQFKKLACQRKFKKIIIKCGDLRKLKTRDGKPKDMSEFYTFIKQLKSNGIDVKVIYYDFVYLDSIGHKERYILYDDVQIYVPGGLDIFDDKGRFHNSGEGFYLKFMKREIQLKGKQQSLS
jgi:hypothetical protein